MLNEISYESLNGQSLWTHINAAYQADGMPIIPVPIDMIPKVQFINPEIGNLWGTKQVESLTLADEFPWVHYLQEHNFCQNLIAGMGGYGVNNNVFYYYLLNNDYFIAMKLPINNYYRNNKADLQDLTDSMAWVESFILNHDYYGFDRQYCDKLYISVSDNGDSGVGFIKAGKMVRYKMVNNPFKLASDCLKMNSFTAVA